MARRKSGGTDGDPRWTSELPPAPGGLRVVQAFVNTADLRQGTDLAGAPALAAWLTRWDLAAPDRIELGDGDLERALEVREALRVLLAGNNGAAVSGAAVAHLDKAAAAAAIRVRFESGGRTRFERASAGLDGALGSIFAVVARAQLDGTWVRLKSCADGSCRAAFYDFSRNRSAKWCSSRCGSRPGSLAYRRRHLQETRKRDATRAVYNRYVR